MNKTRFLFISDSVLKNEFRLRVLNQFASQTFQLQGEFEQKKKHLNACWSLPGQPKIAWNRLFPRSTHNRRTHYGARNVLALLNHEWFDNHLRKLVCIRSFSDHIGCQIASCKPPRLHGDGHNWHRLCSRERTRSDFSIPCTNRLLVWLPKCSCALRLFKRSF